MQNPATSTTHHAPRTTFHVSRFTFHPSAFYLLSLLLFALGLMSKPMLVTWPLVMLLLDYWPLGRMQNAATPNTQHPSSVAALRRVDATRNTQHATRFTFHATRFTLLPLLVEKIPFFVLVALASVVTLVAQQRGGAVMAAKSLPVDARVSNALISYFRYLGKLFWPVNLAVYYPHPGHWPLGKVLLAGGLILGISVLLFVQRRRSAVLLVGWLWFLGTLVPVIGLVQVGGQAMADRYTYLPSLGALILAVWGAYELTRALAIPGGRHGQWRERRQ